MSPVVTTPIAGSGIDVGKNSVPMNGYLLVIHLSFSTLLKYSLFNFCTKYILHQIVLRFLVSEKSHYVICCISY